MIGQSSQPVLAKSIWSAFVFRLPSDAILGTQPLCDIACKNIQGYGEIERGLRGGRGGGRGGSFCLQFCWQAELGFFFEFRGE